MKRLVLLAAAAAVVLAGCTSGGGAEPTRTVGTVTSTVTGTRPPPGADFRPARDTALPNLPPGSKAPQGEKDGTCPYLRTGLNQDPTSKPNVAEIEGNRIYRTTRLTTLQPIGCRFYFIGPPYNPTADIRPQTFATAERAFNAMILTARTGKEATTYKNFVPGLTGISYRTKFDKGEGDGDWAFVFAKGKVVVVVHTSQPISANARYLAQAIAGKF